MRKLLLGATCLTVLVSQPALARDNGWYLEADAGATWVDDIVTYENATPNQLTWSLTDPVARVGTKTGYDFGGIIGYDFGLIRVEADASYRRAGVDALRAYNVTNPATAVTGRASSVGVMLNGLIDLGPDDGLQGFVGGGVGYGNVKVTANGATGNSNTFAVNGSDDGLAWQLLAGLRYPLSDRIDIGLKYRFFNQNSVDLTASQTFIGLTNPVTQSDPVHAKWRSHSALLTLGYNFGSAPPPPPPAVIPVAPPPPEPAPPPPPPPPPPPCNKGPYIVFFDWDKSDITPEASSILDSAVAAYGNCASVPIMLAGYADRSGKPAYNQGLSERRNASVTGYLTSHGIPAGAISSQGFGENNNRVPTADGVRELQNRRVEITYGPGSGM